MTNGKNKNKMYFSSWIVFFIFGICGIVYMSTSIGIGIGMIVFGAILATFMDFIGRIEANTKTSYELLECLVSQQKKIDEHIVTCGQYVCDRLADMSCNES